LYVYDHFKPGIPELAGLLPKALAQPLLRWDRSRAAQGRTPWALPLKIGTHSVGGMLALRTLASFKALRPWSSRNATEQALINEWLQAVVASTQAHWASGHEVALCGQLIKGYGSTNERGKDHLLHVVRHLSTATLSSPEVKATALREARLAALADESGKQLDQTLLRHGAPARDIAPQPIRWMRKPKATSTKAI
jgi:indolepyruvate ferredoxin oxidoreductase beta subunit